MRFTNLPRKGLHAVPSGASASHAHAQAQAAPALPPEPETGLSVGQDFVLPESAVTQSLAIVAQRGKGKTYLAKVFCEELFKNNLPFVIVDLLGVFWGLRATAGGREGFPVPIIGGEHGDVPLNLDMGEDVARWICRGEGQPRSCILDVSELKKDAQRLLVTRFAEELYHRNRRALHVVVDEADFFVPQRLDKITKLTFDSFDAIVRRGRRKGFGITLISQRPQLLNKDVLTQCSVLVAMGMSAPQDLKAIDEWIKMRATGSDREVVLRSLASLPTGHAWFWSPGYLRKLKKVKVRRQESWDSSSTPEVGVEEKMPRSWAKVDSLMLRKEIEEASESYVDDVEDELPPEGSSSEATE